MHKLLTLISVTVGVIAFIIAAIFTYAFFNLNSIIASNRSYILARARDALGRPVEVQNIRAAIGWGIKMDIIGVKVADDPSFSQLPFLEASDVYINVRLLPLLSHSLKVTKLVIKQPQLRIIRSNSGTLNIATLSAAHARTQPSRPSAPSQLSSSITSTNAKLSNAGGLAALTVGSLKIDDGSVSYTDHQAGARSIQISNFNLVIDNFNVNSPFDLTISLAALGRQQDLTVAGKVGPLTRNGNIPASAVPFNLNATIGPLSLPQLQTLPQFEHLIPAALSISQPVTIYSKIAGTLDEINLSASTDLSTTAVVYRGIFNKPANVLFKLNGSLSRTGDVLSFSRAELALATLKAKATNLIFAKDHFTARIETNNFDLLGVGNLLLLTQKYNLAGNAEIHTTVRVANHQPSANGTVILKKISASLPGRATAPISNLTGTIQMTGNSAKVGPVSFNLGSNPVMLQATAQSLQPLRATYRFNAAVVNVGDLMPNRKQLGERASQVAAAGKLNRANTGALSASTNLTSASGMAANIPYRNLTLAASYDNDQLTISSLRLNAFDGTIGAAGVANLAGDHSFNLKLSAANLDVQKALLAQQSKAADTLRGILTGAVQVSAVGTSLGQIKPTLRGNGNAILKNGELLGVNIVGEALRKIDNLPLVGRLVPGSLIARHPELFRSSDTRIDKAALTFVLRGPRLTTHDLNAAAPDYAVKGDGWFDMDKNIDLAARIVLSKDFSGELTSAQRNIVYLTNPEGCVEIPLRITGQLPKPEVLPDMSLLAQRAASHAMQKKLGRLLGNESALGGLFGRGGSTGNAQPPSNPLKQFKNFFK